MLRSALSLLSAGLAASTRISDGGGHGRQVPQYGA